MQTSVFRVYFTNFDYYSANEAETLDKAKDIARRAGFQSQIVAYAYSGAPTGETVMTFCPMVGFTPIR